MKLINILLTVTLLVAGHYLFAQEKQGPETLQKGSAAPDFYLKGIDGKYYSLKDFNQSEILAIVFSCPHCPTAQAYEDRIIKLQDDFKDQGVQVVMIQPNSPKALCLEEQGYTDLGDSFEDMKARAKDKGFNFPFLYDGDDHTASLKYGPKATPHIFIFDKNRKLAYVGRIDDREKIGTATQHDARNAILSILDGKIPSPSETKVFGCSIKWEWKKEWREKLDEDWKKLSVMLEDISVEGVKKLVRNDSEKLRLINVWATWCGPCVAEMPELVNTFRMYMNRDIEFYTIATDSPKMKESAHEFLKSKNAEFTNNFISTTQDRYAFIEAIDSEWAGAIPHTILVEPGGKIVARFEGGLNFTDLRKTIVEHDLIGRYF